MSLKHYGFEPARLELDEQYTPWRKFLAWVGFITIVILAAGIIAAVIFANVYLHAHGI